jgi:hypothetical protein
VADGESSGLQILDISDPSNPVFVGNFATSDKVKDVYISGIYAIVTCEHAIYPATSGIQIIDISDRSNPIFIESYDTPGSAEGIFVNGDLIYVADGSSLQILRFDFQTGHIENALLPSELALGQNYPNPFNAACVISYNLPVRMHVRLDVFNVLGRLVATLVDEEKEAGMYHVTLDGRGLASGIYLYRLSSDKFAKMNKAVCLK